MMALSNSDRELLLSKYLDHELNAEETAAVAEKIHSDPLWRAEFERLRRSDASVAHTVRRFHGQSRLVHEVVRRLQDQPPPNRSKFAAARRRRQSVRRRAGVGVFGWFARAAIVAILAGGSYYGWNYYNAQHPHSGKSLEAVVVANTSVNTTEQDPVLSNEIEFTTWPDGTLIWSRKGTQISSLGQRSLKLSGMAFFHVAPSATPFTIVTSENYRTQALGTRFEITSVKGAALVRVAEGHVRVQADATRSVDAFGGTEIHPDLTTRPFDPRTLAGEWSKLITKNAKAVADLSDNLISPWSQAGGSAARSGITPLSGPARLGGDGFVSLPGDVSRTITTPAIIGVGSRGVSAYVLARSNGDSKECALLSLDLKSGAYAWKVCDKFKGLVECAPVVTPRGLLVYATPEGQVKAYEPSSGNIVWNASTSDVSALTAGNDETVYCSSRANLIALNGRDGQLLWKSNAVAGLKAPVCVLPDGTICAVSEGGVISLLDHEGRLLPKSQKWGDESLTTPVAGPDFVYVTARDGRVAKLATKDGSLQEKAFGRALNCGPLANGLLGVNSSIVDFAGSTVTPSTHTGSMIALVQDGRGDRFVGYKDGVVHLGTTIEFFQITHGDILPGGLSIGSNMLLVTTTQGIQIFE
jgi:outer membrane protein assembly factor BamB